MGPPVKPEERRRTKKPKRSYHPDDEKFACDSPPTKPIHHPSWARKPGHDRQRQWNKRRPLRQEFIPLDSVIPFTDETMGNTGDIHGTTDDNVTVEGPKVTAEDLEMAMASVIESPATKAVGAFIGSVVSGTFEIARMSIDHIVEHKDEYIAVAKDSFNHLYEHKDEYIGTVKEGIQMLLTKSNDCAVEDETRWQKCSLDPKDSLPPMLKSSESFSPTSPWMDPLMPAEIRERYKSLHKEPYSEYYNSPFADLSQPSKFKDKDKLVSVSDRKPIMRTSPLVIAVKTKQGQGRPPVLMRSPTPLFSSPTPLETREDKKPSSRESSDLDQKRVVDSVAEILKKGGKAAVGESCGDDDLDDIFINDDTDEKDGFDFDDGGGEYEDDDGDDDDENGDDDRVEKDDDLPKWMDEVLRTVDEDNEITSNWLVSERS